MEYLHFVLAGVLILAIAAGIQFLSSIDERIQKDRECVRTEFKACQGTIPDCERYAKNACF